jgi:uncharacterized membrane protein
MAHTPEDREVIEGLEKRIAALEWSVQRLISLGARPSPTTIPPTAARAAATAGTPEPERPRVPAPAQLADLPARPKAVPAASPVDWEQWFGSRGLLLVGVVALLAAGGFFFKYAFDRGWVAPGLRVLGGVAAGAGLALAGEYQLRRGIRRYGLAMIGTGGGLAFLAIWAAAGRYGLIDRRMGVITIALATALVATRAAIHEAEGLALWALLGAFLAPIVLAAPDARPELLIAYTSLIAYAAGLLARQFQWRRTFLAALVGYFVITPALVPSAMASLPGLVYLALGGMMSLLVLRDRDWGEARLASQTLAWLLLIMQASQVADTMRWVAAGCGAALLLATWWDARRDPRFQVVEPSQAFDDHSYVFFLAPAAFVVMFALIGPAIRVPSEAATAAVAALYLFTGWRGRFAPFVLTGFALLAVAVAQQWSGPPMIAEWSLVVLLATAAEWRLDQRGGTPVALALGFIVVAVLLVGLVAAGSGFSGAWPFALYAGIAGLSLAAWAWRPRTPDPDWHAAGGVLLWSLAGFALLSGVTVELYQYFDARAQAGTASALAGGLAISVYWLFFAAALVALGFRLRAGMVRSAGLAVAGLAAAKVLLFDLSRLDALYRIASFFGLALIALAVAFAYNRKTSSAAPVP